MAHGYAAPPPVGLADLSGVGADVDAPAWRILQLVNHIRFALLVRSNPRTNARLYQAPAVIRLYLAIIPENLRMSPQQTQTEDTVDSIALLVSRFHTFSRHIPRLF